MPPAVLAAGIGPAVSGVLGLGGAALQSRSAGKAAERQERAAGEALAFQREQAGMSREAYQQREMQRLAGMRALMQRYGLEIPEFQQGYQQPGPQQAPMGPGPAGPGGGGAVPRGAGLSLGELAMRGRPGYMQE